MSKVLTEEEVLSLLAKVASLHPWRHEVNFLRDHITTLQSERDALREALKYARRFLEANEVDLSFIDSALFPASGEPARKP